MHANNRIISPFVAVIFFFMILMIMQVYALMHIAKGQFARWKRYQKVCSSDNEAKEKDMEGICEWLEQVPSIYLSFPRLSLCFLSYLFSAAKYCKLNWKLENPIFFQNLNWNWNWKEVKILRSMYGYLLLVILSHVTSISEYPTGFDPILLV